MNSHSFFIQKNYKKCLRLLNKVVNKPGFENTDALYLKASCHYNLKQYDKCEK